MTDPIGTAQERELIERLLKRVDYWNAMQHEPDADLCRQAADALQSRIAEVGDLKHDLERQMTIANTYVNEVEELRQALADTHNERAQRIAEVDRITEAATAVVEAWGDGADAARMAPLIIALNNATFNKPGDAALSLQRRV